MPAARFITSARTLRWLLPAALAGLFLVCFPPVRIVRLDEAKRRAAQKAFQPERFAEQFWTSRLLPSADRAVDARTLMAAIRANRNDAKSRYARALGLGRVYCYFTRGRGRIVRIDKDAVGLNLAGQAGQPDVLICAGPIFGNAIRDGSGLIDVNLFPNSQDFNRISEEINRIVETRVIPPFLKKVEMGETVSFVGCAEIIDEQTDLDPLRLVPVSLQVQDAAAGAAEPPSDASDGATE